MSAPWPPVKSFTRPPSRQTRASPPSLSGGFRLPPIQTQLPDVRDPLRRTSSPRVDPLNPGTQSRIGSQPHFSESLPPPLPPRHFRARSSEPTVSFDEPHANLVSSLSQRAPLPPVRPQAYWASSERRRSAVSTGTSPPRRHLPPLITSEPTQGRHPSHVSPDEIPPHHMPYSPAFRRRSFDSASDIPHYTGAYPFTYTSRIQSALPFEMRSQADEASLALSSSAMTGRKRRGNLPKESTSILNDW